MTGPEGAPEFPSRRVRALVSYDGAAYHGWQLQPSLPTVQGAIERALERIIGVQVRIAGAGRTDTGVHALGQVASFDVATRIPDAQLRAALNAHLDPDVRIAALETVSDDFHARFSAHWRRYGYLVVRHDSPFLSRYAYRVNVWPDLDRMNAACADLIGDHEFKAFTSQPRGPFGCYVFEARWRAWTGGLAFEVHANRFLHRMVRFLVGACLQVGQEKRPVELFQDLLLSGERRLAPAPAPPMALYFLQVGYAPAWPAPPPSLAGPLDAGGIFGAAP